jgi:bla regulator protein BlaR1
MLPPYIRQEVIHAICWTLIHSLWLGILAAMLAGIIILCTRKLPVVIRYRLLATDLLLFVVAVGITFCYEVKLGIGESVGVGVAERPFANFSRPLVDHRPLESYRPSVDYQPWLNYQPVVNYLNRHAFIIVDIWLICLFIQLSRLMAGLYGIGRLRSTGTKPSGKWNDTLLLLSGQLGLKRRVSLLESAAVKIPAASGFFKPVILIPLGILSNLPAEQVETVLLHELAHIKRGDYLTNLLLHITEAVFFFNPGLRWLNALIRREREACCDDMVLAVTPDRTIYLDALVSFREYLRGKTGSPYAVALGKGRNSLLWRVRRMLTQENKTLDIMEKTILSFGLAAVIAVGLISMKPAQTATPQPVTASAPVTAAPANADAPPPVPPAPVPTVTATTVRDTLPKQLRRDTLQKRKAELNDLAVQAYLYDVMKQHLEEEQLLSNKLLKDTLSRLGRGRVDSMSKDEALQLVGHDLKLAIDEQLLNAEIAKLANERSKMGNEHAKIENDRSKMANDSYRLFNDKMVGSSDRRIQQITRSLKEAGLIPDDNSFTFSLNSERLLVNGKTAPAPVFQKLKEGYLHSPREHIDYMQHGGSTITDICVDKD